MIDETTRTDNEVDVNALDDVSAEGRRDQKADDPKAESPQPAERAEANPRDETSSQGETLSVESTSQATQSDTPGGENSSGDDPRAQDPAGEDPAGDIATDDAAGEAADSSASAADTGEGTDSSMSEAESEVAEEMPRKEWYILKVSSNREKSICDGLKRRVAVEGLEQYFGDIIVPTEDVAEFKNGKRRIVKRKLFPGYIVVNMGINDETWFVVRETPGIGDFTGAAGKPTPMQPHEIERIVKSAKPEDEGGEPIKTAIPFRQGDRVRIKEGTFENFEGDVEGIDEANGRVTVMINIFGRSTPVELEHWQVDAV